MCDRKAVIKNADMSEEMQQDSVECATQALEKYNIEKDIAAHIKKVRTWHRTVPFPLFRVPWALGRVFLWHAGWLSVDSSRKDVNGFCVSLGKTRPSTPEVVFFFFLNPSSLGESAT